MKVAREPDGWRPIARREGARSHAAGDRRTAPNQQVVPRPRSSAGRAGRSVFGADDDGRRDEPTSATERPASRRPTSRAQFEQAIYERWLDGRRLRARRRRFDRRPGAAAVRDHPAAAERHRLAAPGPRPAERGRGPDDPPRPDARAADPLAAGPRPRVDRRAGRPRPDHRRRRRDAAEPRPRALPRADVAVRRRDAAGHAGAAATGRGVARLEPAAVHDGRGLGAGRPRGVHAALPRRPRVSHRGAHQLVPGLPDERVRPRGHPDARDRHALDDPLPPDRRRRAARARARPSRSPRRGPRRSSATPRWRCTPDDARYAALVGRQAS